MCRVSSWSECLDHFSLPISINDEALQDRIAINLIYYQANYLCIVIIALLIVAIQQPSLLIYLLLILLIYIVIFSSSPPNLPSWFSTHPLTSLWQFFAMVVIMLIILGGTRVIAALCVSLLLVIGHCMIRSISIVARTTARSQLILKRTPMAALVHTLQQYEENEMEEADNDNNDSSSSRASNINIDPDRERRRDQIEAIRSKYQSFKQSIKDKYER